MTDLDAAGERRFTGWHMWMLAIAFFGVIIGVNIWLVVASATSWTGMVVEDSYLAGQDYETNRIAHEKQQHAGWAPVLVYDSGVARLTVPDGAGRPVDLGTVTLLVNRPVGGHDDQTVTMTRTPAGEYEAPVTIGVGLWEATVSSPETALGPFELVTRFNVDGAGK